MNRWGLQGVGALYLGLLALSACDGDSGRLALAKAYRVETIVSQVTASGIVVIARRIDTAPEPSDSSVRLNGTSQNIDPRFTTENQAIFDLEVETSPGSSHVVVVDVAGVQAMTSFLIPEGASSLMIVDPPADSLVYVAGEARLIAWEFDGEDPDHFRLLAVFPGGPRFPLLFSETLDAQARSAEIPPSATRQWNGDVAVTVEARRVFDVEGDLATDESSTLLVFASSELTLTRQ